MRGAVCSVHEYLVSNGLVFFICFLSFFFFISFSFPFFLAISIVYELCNTRLIVVVFQFCLFGRLLFILSFLILSLFI